jgi:hypothetical protein
MLQYVHMSAVETGSKPDIGKVADGHKSERGQLLDRRLRRWGYMGVGGGLAAWAGSALLTGPVGWIGGLAVLVGGAFLLAGAALGTGNILSRIRPKNR